MLNARPNNDARQRKISYGNRSCGTETKREVAPPTSIFLQAPSVMCAGPHSGADGPPRHESRLCAELGMNTIIPPEVDVFVLTKLDPEFQLFENLSSAVTFSTRHAVQHLSAH